MKRRVLLVAPIAGMLVALSGCGPGARYASKSPVSSAVAPSPTAVTVDAHATGVGRRLVEQALLSQEDLGDGWSQVPVPDIVPPLTICQDVSEVQWVDAASTLADGPRGVHLLEGVAIYDSGDDASAAMRRRRVSVGTCGEMFQPWRDLDLGDEVVAYKQTLDLLEAADFAIRRGSVVIFLDYSEAPPVDEDRAESYARKADAKLQEVMGSWSLPPTP